MNILVTGSKGFIGSCLAARAVDFGENVISLDDNSRGLNDVQSIKHKFIAHDCREGIAPILDEFEDDGYVKAFVHNMRHGSKIQPDTKIDAVVHLAAGTGSLSRPYSELCELNIDMTKRVYQDAVEHGVKVFVFPTTSLVEGVPDSPYVKSKQDAMDWLMSQNDDIKIIGLQFYNVTGAYNGFSEHRKLEVHVVPEMLRSFIEKKTFVINGEGYDTADGSPGRDYSNVVDVADFILHTIHMQLSDTPFKTVKPIKLGTGVITTTKHLVDMFNDYMEPKFGRKLDVAIGPRRAYDCGWLRCDQPYLHCFRKPTLIKDSLHDELDALLKVVYGVC